MYIKMKNCNNHLLLGISFALEEGPKSKTTLALVICQELQCRIRMGWCILSEIQQKGEFLWRLWPVQPKNKRYTIRKKSICLVMKNHKTITITMSAALLINVPEHLHCKISHDISKIVLLHSVRMLPSFFIEAVADVAKSVLEPVLDNISNITARAEDG